MDESRSTKDEQEEKITLRPLNIDDMRQAKNQVRIDQIACSFLYACFRMILMSWATPIYHAGRSELCRRGCDNGGIETVERVVRGRRVEEKRATDILSLRDLRV